MKKLIVSALVAASVLSAPGAVFTAAHAATPCGPDAPETLRRPGGYCELLGKGGTLASTGELPAAQVVEPVDEAPADDV